MTTSFCVTLLSTEVLRARSTVCCSVDTVWCQKNKLITSPLGPKEIQFLSTTATFLCLNRPILRYWQRLDLILSKLPVNMIDIKPLFIMKLNLIQVRTCINLTGRHRSYNKFVDHVTNQTFLPSLTLFNLCGRPLN